MNRLDEAKTELAEARDRLKAADLEFRAASNRRDANEMLSAIAQKVLWTNAVSRLVREVGELEACEAWLLADIGPGEEA
ncbi:MAG TPA: hypothetical protein DCQ64_25370 [Candidatus Rokubacteria bacterium]|nr:hypothetical protein [Candidatus Rokubacteria bacterium]